MLFSSIRHDPTTSKRSFVPLEFVQGMQLRLFWYEAVGAIHMASQGKRVYEVEIDAVYALNISSESLNLRREAFG